MDGIDVGEKVTRQIVRSLGIGICILSKSKMRDRERGERFM